MTSNRTSLTENRWLPPLVFLLSFIALYLSAMPLLDDPDVPWHIAVGQLLLQTHALPKTDTWSFASNGTTWYLLSWLWDVKLAVIENMAGSFGVFIMAVSASALVPAFVAWRLTRMNVAFPAIMLTLVLTVLCMLEFATARPHLAGYIMILLFHALLQDSRGRTKMLYALPPLMALWVNLHGSFLVGFIMIAAYIIEAIVREDKGRKRALILTGVACAAAMLVNPYGIDIIEGAMRSLDSAGKAYITEWQPLAFGKSIGLSVWLFVFFVTSNSRIQSVRLADKILAFAWLVAALTANRNGAIFVLLSAPYLAACMDEATKDLREMTTPSPCITFIKGQPPVRVWIGCAILYVIFIVGFHALPHTGRILSDEKSVSDAIDYAREHHPQLHYLTDYNLGGQVIYRTQGTLPLFIDSRADTVYSKQTMQDYIAFMNLDTDWQERMKGYGVTGILAGNESKFVQAHKGGQFHDHWKLVFAGKNASVYISAH